MFLKHDPRHSETVKLWNNFSEKQSPHNSNGIIFNFYNKLDSLHEAEKQMDFFLFANAATQGLAFQYADAIKIGNSKYQQMFVVYWHLCKKNKPNLPSLPEWATKAYNNSTKKPQLTLIENLMTRLLESQTNNPNSRTGKSQQTSMIQHYLPALFSEKMMQLLCIAVSLAGFTLIATSTCGLAGLAPFAAYATSYLISDLCFGSIMMIAGGYGFFRIQTQPNKGQSTENPPRSVPTL